MKHEAWYDWIVQCPCGHAFSAASAKEWRSAGGKHLNKSVERSSMTNRQEVQCPKCLLWIDAVNNDL